MSKFLPKSGFKWIDPKEADLNNYTSSSSKGCVFEIDFEYSIKLQKLHNDYPLAPVKSETKKKKKNAVWVSTKGCWFRQYSY